MHAFRTPPARWAHPLGPPPPPRSDLAAVLNESKTHSVPFRPTRIGHGHDFDLVGEDVCRSPKGGQQAQCCSPSSARSERRSPADEARSHKCGGDLGRFVQFQSVEPYSWSVIGRGHDLELVGRAGQAHATRTLSAHWPARWPKPLGLTLPPCSDLADVLQGGSHRLDEVGLLDGRRHGLQTVKRGFTGLSQTLSRCLLPVSAALEAPGATLRATCPCAATSPAE